MSKEANLSLELSEFIHHRAFLEAQVHALGLSLQKETAQRKKAEQQAKILSKRAIAINGLIDRLNASSDLHSSLEVLCDETILHIGASAVFTLLYEEDSGLLFPVCSRGEHATALVAMQPICQIFNREIGYQPYPLIFGPSEVSTCNHPYPGYPQAFTNRTLVCLEMQHNGTQVGVLNVVSPACFTSYQPDQLDLLHIFTSLGAIAIRQAQLLEQVHAGRTRLQQLSLQLLEVQEAERRHLARELHDEIGQSLSSLKLLLEMVERDPEMEVYQAEINLAQELIRQLVKQVREMSLDLRPSILDDLGVLPAVQSLLERFAAQTKIEVDFAVRGLERRFPAGIETAAYRIVQEALTNVARHAKVTQVSVRLHASRDSLLVQVEDMGVGFEPGAALHADRSNGLSGMLERARLLGGQMEIESTPGRGTRLTAELPFGKPLERRRHGRYHSAL